MTMKMYEILELQNLYQSIANMKLPLKTTYKFAQLMRRAQLEIEFYNSKFQDILNQFGQKNDNGEFIQSGDGTSIMIIPGKEAECNAELLELRNLEIDIGEISFAIEELETLDVSIMELNCLMPLIKI